MSRVEEIRAKGYWARLLALAVAAWAVSGCGEAPPKEFEKYLSVGLLEAERGNPPEAEHLLLTAADYIDFKAFPSATVRLAQGFRRVAFEYRQKSHEKKAIENFERSVRLMVAARGEHYRELAGVLIDLAHVYKKSEQFREAEANLERALAIAEKHPEYIHNNLDVALSNVAEVYPQTRKVRAGGKGVSAPHPESGQGEGAV